MNIFKKIAAARVTLQKRDIKRGGYNTYSKYNYFELADFIPHVNEIFNELGLLSVMSYGADEATLTIIDADEPEDKVVFASPMSTANLTAAHDVQNLGAVQTYLRRYLYMAALEIVEGDALDATQGKSQQQGRRNGAPRRQQQSQPQPPPQQTQQTGGGTWQPSQGQVRRIFAIARGVGVDDDGIKAVLQQVTGQESTSGIPTKAAYDEICSLLEAGGVGDGYGDAHADMAPPA